MAAAWGLPDESSAAATNALLQLKKMPGLVPTLFHFELLNVLLMGERRGRLTAHQVDLALDFLRALDFHIVENGTDFDILGYARRYNLTAYDATYLELAVRTDSALATLDRRLANAGISQGLTVVTDAR